jgi:spoIIIJ-associated protein
MENLQELEVFTQKIIDSLGLELTIKSQKVDNIVKLDFRGEDIAILLAHNGDVLNAIEYLINVIFGKEAQEDKIVCDAAGFRRKRERELVLMAQHAAAQVRLKRSPFAFEPMPATERRLLHQALTTETDVRTESQGKGEHRQVVVYPQK